MITAYTEGLAVVLRAWGARGRVTCFLINQVMHDRHSLDRTHLPVSMRFEGLGLSFFGPQLFRFLNGYFGYR